jgi:hypothetical protein
MAALLTRPETEPELVVVHERRAFATRKFKPANGVSYASGVYRFTHANRKLKVSTAVRQRPKLDQQVNNGEAKKHQTGPERDQQKIDLSKPWFHNTSQSRIGHQPSAILALFLVRHSRS